MDTIQIKQKIGMFIPRSKTERWTLKFMSFNERYESFQEEDCMLEL